MFFGPHDDYSSLMFSKKPKSLFTILVNPKDSWSHCILFTGKKLGVMGKKKVCQTSDFSLQNL